MKFLIREMTTLASAGDMPALPLGMSYPRKKGWLLGKATKSRRLKFRKPTIESVMKFLLVPDFSQFFEAVDPASRKTRLLAVRSAAKRYARFARNAHDKSWAGSRVNSRPDSYGMGSWMKPTRHFTQPGKFSHKANKAMNIWKKHGGGNGFTSLWHRPIRNVSPGNYMSYHKAAFAKLGQEGGVNRELMFTSLKNAANIRKGATVTDKKTGKLRLAKNKAGISKLDPKWHRSKPSDKAQYAREMGHIKSWSKEATKLP